MDWTRIEVEAIVADYVQMLALELSGQSFNKAEHRRRLGALLENRSEGSIEFKHCNISAAMIDLGFPYLAGYKPRSNYQALLAEVVAAQVKAKPSMDEVALAAVRQPAFTPVIEDFAKVKSEAPQMQLRAAESSAAPLLRAVKRDY